MISKSMRLLSDLNNFQGIFILSDFFPYDENFSKALENYSINL